MKKNSVAVIEENSQSFINAQKKNFQILSKISNTSDISNFSKGIFLEVYFYIVEFQVGTL